MKVVQNGEDKKTVKSTGAGTDQARSSPVSRFPLTGSPIKPMKVDDHLKKSASLGATPLEVPVYRHREATSILSPMMQRKPSPLHHSLPFTFPLANQAESPLHKTAALPSHAIKPAHPSLLQTRGLTISQQLKGQKLTPLHIKPMSAHTKLQSNNLLIQEPWQQFGLTPDMLLDERYKDPHLRASHPGVEPLREPPTAAHTCCVRYQTTNIPDLPLNQVHLRRQRAFTDPHQRQDSVHFPPPDQVLRNITSQQQQQQAHLQLSTTLNRHRPKAPSTPSTKSSSMSAGAGRGVAGLSSELFAGVPGLRDLNKKGRPSPQPGSSAVLNSVLSAVGGALPVSSQGAKTSAAQSAAADAIQQAQKQQQEVLLQSALFGAQFTALPRVSTLINSFPS